MTASPLTAPRAVPSPADLDAAAAAFRDPSAYADEDRFDAAAALLRRESPVRWVGPGNGYEPFWAVTRHADIVRVERDPCFTAAPRPQLQPAAVDAREKQEGTPLRTLMYMDGAEHRAYRAIAGDWFRRADVRAALQSRARSLASRYVTRLGGAGNCDFVAAVSELYPLGVILPALGLAESDAPRVLRLTRELFGGADQQDRRSGQADAQAEALLEFLGWLTELVRDRRARPAADLATVIATARPGGALIPLREAASYCLLAATAGHDTTGAALAGGLRALLDHPAQMARLRAEPALLDTATEEMLRWTTPVKAFMRTAAAGSRLAGALVPAGDAVYLAYASANRDEAVFGDPYRFDVTRQHARRHLAFGAGPHHCLAAWLARTEMRALFGELLDRAALIEPAGPPSSRATTFVGGLRSLPVRCTLRS